jgi:hypothetical protein
MNNLNVNFKCECGKIESVLFVGNFHWNCNCGRRYLLSVSEYGNKYSISVIS